MNARKMIVSALLVGSLIAVPAAVMAGGAKHGSGGAKAPASAIQQRDRLHDSSNGTTPSQDRAQAQDRARTQDPAHTGESTGKKSRNRKGP